MSLYYHQFTNNEQGDASKCSKKLRTISSSLFTLSNEMVKKLEHLHHCTHKWVLTNCPDTSLLSIVLSKKDSGTLFRLIGNKFSMCYQSSHHLISNAILLCYAKQCLLNTSNIFLKYVQNKFTTSNFPRLTLHFPLDRKMGN